MVSNKSGFMKEYKGMKMEIIQSEDHGGPHLPTTLMYKLEANAHAYGTNGFMYT